MAGSRAVSLPRTRLLPAVFGGAAVVAVLATLTGFEGWVPDAAFALALLTAAAAVALLVRPPLARWALAAGLVALIATWGVAWVLHDDVTSLAMLGYDLGRAAEMMVEVDYAATVALLLATVALTVGVAALPRFRRPVWLTAVACVVALMPVVYVTVDAVDGSHLPVDHGALFRHLAPGLAATVLAGLALVLAVSRADRWFLLPAGALLLQLTAAQWIWGSAGSVAAQQALQDVEVSTAFLEPGLRMAKPASATVAIEFDAGGAFWTAALLMAAALLAAGAIRTAGTDSTA
jgi:hypothetical protein